MTYAIFYILGLLSYILGVVMLVGSVVLPFIGAVGAPFLFLNGTLFMVGAGIVNAINQSKDA